MMDNVLHAVVFGEYVSVTGIPMFMCSGGYGGYGGCGGCVMVDVVDEFWWMWWMSSGGCGG